MAILAASAGPWAGYGERKMKITKPEAAALAMLRLGDKDPDVNVSTRLVKKGLAYWMGGKLFISDRGLKSLVLHLVEHEKGHED